jgi:histidinol phosphatase-like PHP family hydrolase
MDRSVPPGLVFRARELDLTALPAVDSHLHTSWTDGKATVEETYERAVQVGLEVVLYSEHSRKTSTDWFSRFASEVRALPRSPCAAYVGTEVKVELHDGTIDTVPAITDHCDVVMASVHRFPDVDGTAIPFADVDPAGAVQREYELSWAVLANPQVDILGHVFGMSFRRYKVVPPDDKIAALMARAAEFGVAVEINSHYHPEPFQMIKLAQDVDAIVTFGSNAHELGAVGAIMRVLRKGPGA